MLSTRTNPSKPNKHQSRWALASLLMLLAVFAFDQLINARPSERTLDEEVSPQMSNSADVIPLQFTDVALPPVPPAASQSKAKLSAETPFNKAPAELPKAEHIIANTASASASIAGSNLSNNKTFTPLKEVNETQVQHTMSELSGAQLQIAMPSSAPAREHVLNYLYECAGVGLAALHQQADGNSLMPLTKIPAHASGILRSISGQMSQFERKLQAAYAPTKSLVRVYPIAFDWALSKEIARNLQGKKLTHFFAEYHLHQHSLSLTNIRLNNTEIAQTWLLFDGYAQGCSL